MAKKMPQMTPMARIVANGLGSDWIRPTQVQKRSGADPSRPHLLRCKTDDPGENPDLEPSFRLKGVVSMIPNLSTAELPAVAARVPVPAYDRSAVRPGIVHFGVGGFHRAHQAMYLDRLLADGEATDWGICGVGVLPSDQRLSEIMAAQDCLYALVLKHPDGSLEPRVIGSIIKYLFAPDDPEAVIAQLADAQTKIISLTVTEGGYSLNDATGEFDPGEEVLADLVPGAQPRTMLGLLTAGLARRREVGLPAVTVMSCDNIQGNGDVAKLVVTGFARLKDPALADWIEAEVAFPNSMVDRITPATTDDDRTELARRFEVIDEWPVVCEPFTQWVLEDHFATGRPPYEAAGVQLVADVEPYELMKLRLLNAGHQVLAYLGYLSGYRYVHEVCADQAFVEFLLGYLREEGVPTLSPVPGVDLDGYCQELIDRFSSTAVRDTLLRLAFDGSERLPKFLIPVIKARHAAGQPAERAILTVAAWAKFVAGVDERGEQIDVPDRRRDQLLAAATSEDDLELIKLTELFGDLAEDERFVASYRRARAVLAERGARESVASFG